MNICILTDKYPPDVGGLAVSSRRLARGLGRAGHAVCVSASSASIAPGNIVWADDDDVKVGRIGPHRRTDDTLADWFDQIVALHVRQRFDVIHAMYVAQSAFVAVTAARYLGVPSVVSARGNDLDRTAFDPARFSQISWTLQNASAVTAVTTDLVRKAQVIAPGCRPHFIPNGVDAALFAPGPRDQSLAASLGLSDAPVIAFVGEARRKKGLSVLLLAFAQVCAHSDPSPILLLVGGVRQDDQPILDVFCRQNPQLAVRIVPNVAHQELPAYYRLTDMLVIPSLHDGMPNALLEGMACERAVVASQVGGMLEVLRDGENGLLVPPGDVDALAEAMSSLIADPACRARLGQAARLTMESGFTPEREVQRNLEIYQRVLRET